MSQKRLINRLLSFVLCLAMVLTSVNLPTLTLSAKAVDNAFAGTSTNGASYNAETKRVTFFVTKDDSFFSEATHMFYKEYATYEEAAAAHISTGNNFIDGLPATNFATNNDEIKSTEVAVSDGTGAILYMFNVPGAARADYEHIIVIGDTAGDDEGTTGGDDKGTTGGEDEGPDASVSAKSVNFDNMDRGESIDLWVGGANGWGNSAATYTTNGTSMDVDCTNIGSEGQVWQIQLKLLNKVLKASEVYNVSFDIVSNANKNVFFKVGDPSNDDTVLASKDIKLTAGTSQHISLDTTATTADLSALIVFAMGNNGDDVAGSAAKVTISNLKIYSETAGNAVGGEVSDYINLEEKKAEEGAIGGWNTDSATYDGTSVTLLPPWYGGAWENAWALQNIDLTAGNWQVEYDITAVGGDKAITFQLTTYKNAGSDEGVILHKEYTLNTENDRTYHSNETVKISEDGKYRLLFAVGAASEAKSVVISNIKLTKLATIAAPVIKPLKVSKTDGYIAGKDSPVLGFTDDADWRAAITAVKVNNKTLAKEKYTLAEGTLTLDKTIFRKQGVNTVEVIANGYKQTSASLPIYAESVANEDWEIEWQDEFDGDSLDLTKWDYEIGVKSGDDATSDAPIYWGNNEKEYYIKEAAEVKDGKLIITGKELTPEVKAQYNITDETVKYSSARIRTISEDGSNVLFATTYGRVEAKIELPEGKGYWPAFWMLPTPETTDIYGTWAASGELDIMEAVGQNNNYVNGTIHYGSQWPNNIYSGGTHYFDTEETTIGDAHVYAVEWEPGEIRWYVDDILYHVENNWYGIASGASANYTFPAPFDEDFYILFNLAMDGNYVGNVGIDEPGKSMKVDYVRVYKDKNFDYEEKEANAKPVTGNKDSEFFEANTVNAGEDGNYVKDLEYTTIDKHVLPGGSTLGGEEIPVLSEWYVAVASPAKADHSVVERDGVKYAKIDVKTKGANNYDVQLMQHVPLATGYTYKLMFDAYTDTDAGRSFSVAPKGDGDNSWAGYASGINADLTKNVQTFEYLFTMNKDSDPTARIEMNIGNATGAVYVGNVRLYALTDEQIEEEDRNKANGPKTPLANGEHIYNGSFDQGTGRFEYWNTVGDYTADLSARSMKAVINSSTKLDDAQLVQTGIQLLEGDTYKLTLKAKADASKAMKVALKSANGKTTYASKLISLGTTEKDVTLEFAMPKSTSDTNASLVISFGGNTTSVEIDDVSMMRTSNKNVEWNASILYPLGGETWTKYTEFVWEGTEKDVPEDGIVKMQVQTSTENWHYMIFKDVTLKPGYTYNVTYDVKADVADQKIAASIQDGSYNVLVDLSTETTTDWKTVSSQFTATTGDGTQLKFCLSDPSNTTYNLQLKNVYITVKDGPYLVFDETPAKLKVGQKYQLGTSHAVDVNPEYNVFAYTSSNTAVATVEDGVITAKAAGTTKITSTSKAGATKSFTLEVVTEDVSFDEVDTKALDAKITEAKKYLSMTDTYSADSLADLAKAIKNAEDLIASVKDGVIASQATVDAALAAIDTAIAGLCAPIASEDGSDDGSDDDSHIGIWIEPIPDQEYTGAAIKALPLVYDGIDLLTLNKDYTLKYKDNKKVGTATVTITGKGNYKGKYNTTFNIVAKDITADGNTIYAVAKNKKVAVNSQYKKNVPHTVAVKPVVTTVINGKSVKLKANTDYTVAYNYSVDVACTDGMTGTVTVTGKGSYKGEITYPVVFVTNKNMLMSNAKITVAKSVDYTGAKLEPEVVVKAGGKVVANSCYSVAYADNISAGKATVIVTGDGKNMFGTKTATFTIKGKDIKKAATIEGLKDVDYTGEAWEPAFVVKADGKELVKGVDYTVNYSNNVKPGKATVTVTGQNAYQGKLTATFKINKVTLTDKMVTVAEKATYTKTGAKAEVIVKDGDKVLVAGKDYKLAYSKNTAVGDATVKVTGLGGYTGKITKTFKVEVADFAQTVVSAVDVVDGTKLAKVKATVTDGGKKLGNKEYTVSYKVDGAAVTDTATVLKAGSTVEIIATAAGANYKANTSSSTVIRVGKATIAKAKVTVKAQDYTGEAVTLTKDDITEVKVGRTVLTKDQFEIVAVGNNVAVGKKATVTIVGVGDYCGSRTATFAIVQRDVESNWTQIAFQRFLDLFF